MHSNYCDIIIINSSWVEWGVEWKSVFLAAHCRSSTLTPPSRLIRTCGHCSHTVPALSCNRDHKPLPSKLIRNAARSSAFSSSHLNGIIDAWSDSTIIIMLSCNHRPTCVFNQCNASTISICCAWCVSNAALDHLVLSILAGPGSGDHIYLFTF